MIITADGTWKAFMLPPALVSENENFLDFPSRLMGKMLRDQQHSQPASQTEESLGAKAHGAGTGAKGTPKRLRFSQPNCSGFPLHFLILIVIIIGPRPLPLQSIRAGTAVVRTPVRYLPPHPPPLPRICRPKSLEIPSPTYELRTEISEGDSDREEGHLGWWQCEECTGWWRTKGE